MLSLKPIHPIRKQKVLMDKSPASGIYLYLYHTFIKPVGGLATEKRPCFFQVYYLV